MKFGKSSQKRIQFETSVTVRSPGLEFNDIGYMRYSDIIHQGTWVAYYIRNPFAIFNNFYLNTNYWMYWNFSGKLLSTNANINFNSQFKNRWRLNGQFNRQSENISTTFLRGGPSFIAPGNQSFSLNLNTDQSKKVAFNMGNYHGNGDAHSYKIHEYWGGVYYKPLNSIFLTFEPDYLIQKYDLQYVTTEGTNAGNRYLFGNLDQKTMSFTIRLNYTINPELSVEYYGQPFISAGKYSNYKEITDVNADRYLDRFRVFTPGEYIFNSETNSYEFNENSAGNEVFSVSNLFWG